MLIIKKDNESSIDSRNYISSLTGFSKEKILENINDGYCCLILDDSERNMILDVIEKYIHINYEYRSSIIDQNAIITLLYNPGFHYALLEKEVIYIYDVANVINYMLPYISVTKEFSNFVKKLIINIQRMLNF